MDIDILPLAQLITTQAPDAAAIAALFVAVLLLMASAFVSGSEIAFFSLTQSELDECSESESLSDKRILHLVNNPERLLATILIANDFVNVCIVMLDTLYREACEETEYLTFGR